jgi:hypothetical protein
MYMTTLSRLRGLTSSDVTLILYDNLGIGRGLYQGNDEMGNGQLCEIKGSYGYKYEDYLRLRCNAV